MGEFSDDCKRSLISLKACGICRMCKCRITEIKAILRFYENKNDGKTQRDLDNKLS